MRSFLLYNVLVLAAVGFATAALPFVENPLIAQDFELPRPSPVANNNGPDPDCGGLFQKPCRPCGMDGELPCGYAPARVGVISDSSYQPNPYKMFWKPHTAAQLSVCEFPSPGVTPMTWNRPSNNPDNKEYLLINGDVNVHVDNYRRSWMNAQEYCKSHGATLANPKNMDENNFVWCLQPMLENRWLGIRVTWVQSPNFDIQMQKAIDQRAAAISAGTFFGNVNDPVCFFLISGEQLCELPPKTYLNGEIRSAEKRKQRRTMGSILVGGNYSDDTKFIPPFNAATFSYSSNPPVFGNPEIFRPYITGGTYKTISPWHLNEPNNRRGVENCVEMGKPWARHAPLGEWNDFRCGAEKAFVCERQIAQ